MKNTHDSIRKFKTLGDCLFNPIQKSERKASGRFCSRAISLEIIFFITKLQTFSKDKTAVLKFIFTNKKELFLKNYFKNTFQRIITHITNCPTIHCE